jgi:enoyl-CoA hydratase/carnithine racemase
MPSELICERTGPVLVLTLRDPATRNTLSPQVYAAGLEALSLAEEDDALRAVILRGDGAHFCAGGDLQRIARARSMPATAQADAIDAFHSFVLALRAFPRPVIAAVEGWAAGGGFSLALACDLIVASSEARFVMSYGKVGLSPDGGASWHLTRALPRSLALECLWLAQPLGAERLQALGLVTRVCAPGQSLHEALQLADALAQMAPNAVSEVKSLVAHADVSPLAEHLAAEREAFVKQLFHDNTGEGIAAFQAKRSPRFR